MTCYTVGLAFLGPMSLVLQIAGIEAGQNGFMLFCYGCGLSGLASNIFATMVPKR